MKKKANSTDEDKSKKGMARLISTLKRPEGSALIPMPNYPEEKILEMPEKLEGDVVLKRIKKRRLNLSRKYHAELSKGILKLYNKKSIGKQLTHEFKVDLAKVAVMYDERRLLLKFQVESHIIVPVDISTFDKWKDSFLKHRLYRQGVISTGIGDDSDGASDIRNNHDTLSCITASDDPSDWNNSAICNRVMDDLHQMQGLTMDVLDKLTKTYEDIKKTASEMRQMQRELKEVLSRAEHANHVTSGAIRASDEHKPSITTTTIAVAPSEVKPANGMTNNGATVAPNNVVAAKGPIVTKKEKEEEEDDEYSTDSEIEEDANASQQNQQGKLIFSLEATSNDERKKELIAKSIRLLETPDVPQKATEVEGRTTLTPLSVASSEGRERSTSTASNMSTSFASTTAATSPMEEASDKAASARETIAVEPSAEVKIPEPVVVIKIKPRTRREILPSPQCASESLGMKAFYNMAVHKSGLPLSMYEPIGTLQILCEELKFSHLLDKAAKATLPEDKLAFICAFAMSSYTNGYGRWRKPFNPILGETFDYMEQGWRFHAEQVSHHPPISAAHCEGTGWTWWTTLSVDMSMSKFSQTCELTPDKPVRLRVGVDEFSWNKIKTRIENVAGTPEQRRIFHEGIMHIRSSTGYFARIYFKNERKAPREVYAEVVAPNERVCYRLFGHWDKNLIKQRTTGEKEVLLDNSSWPIYSSHYGFSRFTMGLNELHSDEKSILPPTDSRFRPDMRALEMGLVSKATTIKEQLEKQQRSRLKNSQPPIWFENREDDFTKKKLYLTNSKYWPAREKSFKDQKESNIFVPIFQTSG